MHSSVFTLDSVVVEAQKVHVRCSKQTIFSEQIRNIKKNYLLFWHTLYMYNEMHLYKSGI